MHPLISIAITLGCLVFVMLLSAWAVSSKKISGELARKSVHVGMGVICMTFPWLFDSVLAVQILAAVAVLSLILVRVSNLKKSLGSALFSVQRLSIGELLFPIAVAWLFTLGCDRPVFYLIALLLLTMADTVGALAGSRFGKKVYQTIAGTKSLEGSVAFFLTAFICAVLPLYFWTEMHLTQVLMLAFTVSLFTTAVEGLSGHGIDNLLIPIGAFLLLDYYSDLENWDLIVRSLLLVVLLVFLLVTHRQHELDGGAILASILFGFAAFTLGGVFCFLAAMVVFIRHWVCQICVNQQRGARQSIDTIIAIGVPSLVWLTLGRGEVIAYQLAQLGFIYTMAIVIAMLHSGTCRLVGHEQPSMFGTLLMSVLTVLPVFLIKTDWVATSIAITSGVACAYAYFHWRKEVKQGDLIDMNAIKLGVLGTACSPLPMISILL